jgi:vitamin B12 transporter
MRRTLILIFAVMFFVGSALADEVKTVELEPIVVTPYRTAIDAGISPAATDIIYIEDSQREGKRTFTDAIKNITSLSYATSGGMGGDTSIYIRGAQAYHTQVMLDGIKIYDPISTQGYFYASNYMSLDNIERIEVAKGPYSSLYGSGSIGGTINLTPRRGQGKPSFSYLQEGGSYDALRGVFSAQGEIEKLDYALSTSWTSIKGFYAARKDENPDKDPYRDFNSSLNLNYAVTDSVELGLVTDYTYSKYSYDGFDTVTWDPADANNNAHFHQGVMGLNLNHIINDLFSHKISTGYTRTYRKSWEDELTHGWYNAKTYQAKWKGDFQIYNFNKIIVGFDYLREAGENRWDDMWGTSLTPKRTTNTKGFYIENIFTPWDNVFVSGSYRRERHSQFGDENTFSAAGGYRIKQTGTNLKASFGQGFRAPSIYELYNPDYGNVDLSAEKSNSLEAGLDQDIVDKLKIGSTYFQNNIKNLIEWDGQYQNIDKAKIYGVENYLKYDLNANTVFKVSYTYMDATKRPDRTRLVRRPQNKITGSLSTSWDKLFIYGELSYVGNRMDSGDAKLKSYILANASLNYQINDNVELSLRLENILNRDYQLIKGYQTPKFSGYVGAKVKF